MPELFRGRGPKGKPIRVVEDIREFLGAAHHLQEARSAWELANAWITAKGIPASVAAVLRTHPEWRAATLREGWFERQTNLRTAGRDSQTDLLVLAETAPGPAVIAVEGKVDETFGPTITEWLADVAGDGGIRKRERLNALCATLGLPVDVAVIGTLRYQLFHRAAAALFEAESLECAKAMLLVHSFSHEHRGLSDFRAFAAALNAEGDPLGTALDARVPGNISLSLGWVADRVVGTLRKP